MQGSDNYRLVVRRGPQPNQVYELKEDVINLGRDITNDIVINDREVSRHHLRLMRGPEGYTIEDLGSTNGTFINGKRLSGASSLKNGDMVGLGETVTLGYEVARAGGGFAAQPPAPAPSANAPESPYQPPAQPQQPPQAQPQQPPAQPAYQPPASSYDAPQEPYEQPAPSYQPQADPYYSQAPAGAYGSPPPPGYDYDPYAAREEEGTNWGRWLLIGCVGLMVMCCCLTIVSAVVVDQLDLYCSIPVVGDVVEALGLKVCP